jgi:hypothetical protein
VVWPEKDWEELLLILATQRLLKRVPGAPRSLPRSVLGSIETPLPTVTLPSRTVMPFTTSELAVKAPTSTESVRTEGERVVPVLFQPPWV